MIALKAIGDLQRVIQVLSAYPPIHWRCWLQRCSRPLDPPLCKLVHQGILGGVATIALRRFLTGDSDQIVRILSQLIFFSHGLTVILFEKLTLPIRYGLLQELKCLLVDPLFLHVLLEVVLGVAAS